MGLDASVRCRCWEDGLTSEPPIPPEMLEVDEENTLGVPTKYDDEHFEKFEEWKKTACAHESFDQAKERIGNWSNVGGFLSALERAGADHYPTLLAEVGGDLTPPERSALCLSELDQFARNADLGTAPTLFDDTNGETLRRFVPGGNAWFLAANPWRIGFDEDGFFVRRLIDDPPTIDTEPPASPLTTTPSRHPAASDRDREVFRSKLFTQEVIHPGPSLQNRTTATQTQPQSHSDQVRLRLSALDRPCDIELQLREPIEAPVTKQPDGRHRWNGHDYPRRFRVAIAPIPADTYTYIVDALKTVFRASVEAHHPVTWI